MSNLWLATNQGTSTTCTNTVFKLLNNTTTSLESLCDVRQKLLWAGFIRLMEQQLLCRVMHTVHLLENIVQAFFCLISVVRLISAVPPSCFFPSSLRIQCHHFFELQVIQQAFGATDSSRKRRNKYFIFHLLKSNVVWNRVQAGAQSCLNQICASK